MHFREDAITKYFKNKNKTLYKTERIQCFIIRNTQRLCLKYRQIKAHLNTF